MRIGLVDVDGHNGFPNIALMKIARHYHGSAEWAMPMFGNYDSIYASKVFTFSTEPNWNEYNYGVLYKGGTGYDIKSKLPPPNRGYKRPRLFHLSELRLFYSVLFKRLHKTLPFLPRTRQGRRY